MEDHKRYVQKALNYAYFYLKFRPRTENEVIQYLSKKSKKDSTLSAAVINEALDKLKQLNFINDKEFIEWFVDQRSLHKHKGEYALRQELQRFGVNKEAVDLYFLETPLDQDTQSRLALEAKWYRFSSLDKKTRFQKAAAYLSRKGFPFDVIKKTIAQMENPE